MNIPVANPKVTEGKDFPIIEEGTFQARIVQIIDLGTITNNWNGNETFDRTFAIRFETPTETTVFDESKGEQPFLVTDNVKFKVTREDSQMKSKLDKIIAAVGDKASAQYNIFDLLNRTLLIEIKHNQGTNGKTYANIVNYAKLVKGMVVEDRINDLKALYLDPEYFDQSVFETLGEYTQNKIMESPEWQQLQGKMPEGQSNAVHAEIPDITEEEINNIQVPF